MRVYYNQAPPAGESYTLFNYSYLDWSGSASPFDVNDTYADYTWDYPYNQGSDLVLLADGSAISSPFTIDFSVTQPATVPAPDSPESTSHQFLSCGSNCATVRVYYSVPPPPGGWALVNWQNDTNWSFASSPVNIHDTYADYEFTTPYIPATLNQYTLASATDVSSPFTIDWSQYSSTSVSSSDNPSSAGGPVTYTATVTGPSGTLPPSGEAVEFDDGGMPITGCDAVELSATSPYTAACTVTYDSPDGSPHSITATYSGDASDASSISPMFSETVNPAVPDAPTTASAIAGEGSATVSWSPPDSDGGSPVTSYTVTASDITNPANGGQTATGPTWPLEVAGLTQGDIYTFTVTATNAVGTSNPSAPSNPVTIEPEVPAITSPASAVTSMRQPFSFTVTTLGLPVDIISESGPLPAGITFTDNGDGTATLAGGAAIGTAGNYPVTITAENGDGPPATQQFTLTVTTATSSPSITSNASDTETFGAPFTFTVTTTGFPAPKLSKSGTLPPGVTFTDNHDGSATIAGTPAKSAVGTYNLTLTASSSAGTVVQAFALTITKAPVINKISATTAQVGTPLTLTITAAGEATPALAEQGTLPAGLSFTDNGNGTATINGTPAAGSGGTYPLTITATNSLGTASQNFALKVDEQPVITSPDSASGSTSTPLSFLITVTGYPNPKITVAGTLPAGITFKSATDTLAGTPKTGAAGGNYSITITATNSSGTNTQSFTLTIF